MNAPRILITEDEMLVALDLQQRLANLGYDVPVVAGSGEEAIEQAAAIRPDLVLMDIMLQGELDGIEAAQRIRSRSDIPVIFLTANADSTTLQRAQCSEAASYLLKPFRERELQISIEMALSNHRLKRQLREAHDLLEARVLERTAELEAANRSLKVAEQESSGWKNRYDLIVASSGLAIYDIDYLTGKTVWGSGAERILGHPANELNRNSENWLNWIHPEDQIHVVRQVGAATAAGFSFNVDYRFRHGSGNHIWIHERGFFVRDAQGRCVRMLGVLQDVTQRKVAEEKMREQATLLDQTQDAIMVRDLENRVRYWNQAAERFYGWNVNEVIGRPIQDLLLKGDLAHMVQARAAALKEGHWSGEVRVFAKSGKELIIHSRWTLLRDGDGKPHAFLVAHTDLTERRMLEAKFLRAQRLESIGALASGIAHDLNNVFTPILMSAQLLENDLDSATRAAMLKTVQTAARRGSEMVKQVLSFTRGLHADAGHVQVKHLISEMERLARDTFPRGIQVRTNVPTHLAAVKGDSTQLYQVLMNLCINARDAMPDGGVLTISAEDIELAASAVKHDGGKPGSHIVVTVADTGVGMLPAVVERVFEPFFTTKEPGKGTGLGLSTVRSIATAHGGWVEVESQPGVGTKFRLCLPSVPASKLTEEISEADAPEGNGELLLVVDDEFAIREILKTALEAKGYEVLTAAEGTEAVATCASNPDIALAIVDMMMPVMDGQQTIRVLKKMNPGLKLLAVSGLMDQARLTQISEMEGVQMLKKPYSTPHLLRTIHQLLRSSR